MEVYEFEDIKRKIRPRLFRQKGNEENIKKVPHMDITAHSLSVVFYVELGKVNNMNMGFYITNKHLEIWDVTIDELLEEAITH